MARYILVILIALFFGALYLRQAEQPKTTPREAIDIEVAKARKDNKLDRETETVLRVQLAILDYMAREGTPPQGLENLVPEYFDALPRNPETNKPFEYSRNGMSYELKGSGTLDAPNRVASNTKAAGTKPGATPTGAPTLEPTEFVNPNTMAPDTFVYDPSGRRDPFKAFDFSSRPHNASGATPLERYSLGQLRLTAVIMDKDGGTAFVEDAAGKGYPIRIGAKIGDQGGTVVAIEPNKLKVLEISTDLTGTTTQREVEMRIQSALAQPAGKKR